MAAIERLKRIENERTDLYILWTLTLWNIVTFILYGVDKRKAKKNKWRISETTLIACAFLMGAVGSLLGMSVFRHKTKHLKFKLLLPLAAIANVGIIVCYIYFR